MGNCWAATVGGVAGCVFLAPIACWRAANYICCLPCTILQQRAAAREGYAEVGGVEDIPQQLPLQDVPIPDAAVISPNISPRLLCPPWQQVYRANIARRAAGEDEEERSRHPYIIRQHAPAENPSAAAGSSCSGEEVDPVEQVRRNPPPETSFSVSSDN